MKSNIWFYFCTSEINHCDPIGMFICAMYQKWRLIYTVGLITHCLIIINQAWSDSTSHCYINKLVWFLPAWLVSQRHLLEVLYLLLNKWSVNVIQCLFSHTQWVSVTLAIRLCPSSSLSSAWTFSVFRLLLSNRCTDLLQILCGCFLGGPLLSLLKSGCYHHLSWNYG